MARKINSKPLVGVTEEKEHFVYGTHLAGGILLLLPKSCFLCFLLKLKTHEEPYISTVMLDLINVPLKVTFTVKNCQMHTA